MMLRMSHVVVIVAVTVSFAALSWADPFTFSTNSPDGRLGALSQPPNSGALETETADDFLLTATTSITEATIVGLVPAGNIAREHQERRDRDLSHLPQGFRRGPHLGTADLQHPRRAHPRQLAR